MRWGESASATLHEVTWIRWDGMGWVAIGWVAIG